MQGTYSISTTKHSLIFHSPYANQSYFFEWYRNTGSISHIATDTRHFKALRNGVFYTYDQQGYEIYAQLSKKDGRAI